MFSTFVFILVLSFLVLIHELGHFVAAKWAKVKVEEFGLGYPPRALTLFTWKGTIFSLNWIPFGGFVRMEGEELAAGDQNSVALSKKQKTEEQPFYTRTAWQRLVVILAGVTVNLVFAFLAFSFYFAIKGIPAFVSFPASIADREQIQAISVNDQKYTVTNQEELDSLLTEYQQSQPRIGFVMPQSPAAEENIPTNVKITQVATATDKQAVSANTDLIDFVQKHRGETVTLTTTLECQGISCPEATQDFNVYLRRDDEILDPAKEGPLGIGFDDSLMVFYPTWQMPLRGSSYGLQQSIGMSLFILQSLGDIVRIAATKGRVSAEVGGPVAIVRQASDVGLFNRGFLEILHFAGLLSVNLAIINLLPIPALDGGRAVFILLEKIVGKTRLAVVEGYANYAGFIFLIGLMVLITARDLYNLVVG